jgi:hypothetical protein
MTILNQEDYTLENTVDEAAVRDFLRSVKWAIQKSNTGQRGWIFSTASEKNLNTLAKLEMTIEDVKKEILALSVVDYCSGPLTDPKIRGDVWIFKKIVQGEEIYIKLKLWGDKRDLEVRVLSFHIAERPLLSYFEKKAKEEMK